MATQTQLTRDQHTVPQLHLRNYTDANGVLWRYMQGRPVKRSRPKGECWELDFYECELNGQKSDNRYENWLGGIENNAAIVLYDLLNGTPFNSRNTPIWAKYVASMFVRSQKYRSQISAAMSRQFKEQSRDSRFVRDLQYERFKRGELIVAEDIEKEIERTRTQMEISPAFYHLLGLQRLTASLGNALMMKSLQILKAAAGKFLFTSDCPVLTAEFIDRQVKPGAGFGKEHSAILLPLTPQDLFVAASPRSRWIPVLEPRHVDAINRLTVQFAHKRVFASENSPGIKALVDAEINTVVFGHNAFLPPNQN